MAAPTLSPLTEDRSRDELLARYTDPDTCPTDALIPVPLAEEPAFISWQQEIPRDYLAMEPAELDRRIRAARAAIGDKLDRGVLALGEDLAPVLPFLRDLFSIDPGDPAVAAMDPKLRRVETFQATHRVLERAAARRPHVIVIEDLHWMDQATEEWTAVLADTVRVLSTLSLLLDWHIGRPLARIGGLKIAF